jgi:hypothetical protein
MAGEISTTALDQAALDQIAARLKGQEQAREAARAAMSPSYRDRDL